VIRAGASDPRVERGAALVLTLLIMAIISAIGLACVLMARAETMLGSAFEHSAELIYAADAAVTKVQVSLCRTAAPLAGVQAFDDGRTRPVLADGTTLDLSAETAARQRDSDAVYGTLDTNPDAPQWRLVAHAPLADLVPDGAARPAPYVAIWLADDGEDGDGDPGNDRNGKLLVEAGAFGVGRGLHVVQVTLACASGLGRARVAGWRLVR
jgi:hypothetical protein